jgi:hypothetical protein
VSGASTSATRNGATGALTGKPGWVIAPVSHDSALDRELELAERSIRSRSGTSAAVPWA